MHSKTRQPKEALPLIEEAVKLRDALPPSITAEAEFRLATAATNNNLAVLLAATGKSAEADEVYNRTVETLAKLVEDYPSVPAYRSMWADAQMNRALHQAASGQFALATATLRAALPVWEQLAAQNPQAPEYGASAERARGMLKELEAVAAKPGDEKPEAAPP